MKASVFVLFLPLLIGVSIGAMGCGEDATTLGVQYTVATGADAEPDFVVLISLAPDGATFDQNFDAIVGSGSQNYFFYDLADNLKKCAVDQGFINPQGFISGSTVSACANLGSTTLSHSFYDTFSQNRGSPGAGFSSLPNNPLSTEGSYKLLDPHDGYFFALFFYHADQTRAASGYRCFEICAAQIQSKRFMLYDSGTSSLTASDTLNCNLARVSQINNNSKCFDY
jgi:hypothetical protein